jgi:hypothetical protein
LRRALPSPKLSAFESEGGKTVDQLQLLERVVALEDELARLRAEVSSDAPASRRDVFKKLAVAGAGVAAGAVATAAPAAANDPNDLTLGTAKTTPNFTRADYTGSAVGAAFVFQAGSAFTNAPSESDAALAGWTSVPYAHAGVYGFSGVGRGQGVVGRCPGGVGVLGDGTIGAEFTGSTSNVRLVPAGPPAPDRPAGAPGALVEDAAGDLWLCVASTPNTWRKLGGPATAGQLHVLPAPVRVYDSRPGGANDGPLSAGSQRVISLATGTSGGATVPAVPAGAVAALLSLTLDATTGAGFLAVFANGISHPGNSNANWYTSGQILAVTTVTAVDADAKAIVLAGGVGATQFVIDIIGYYR